MRPLVIALVATLALAGCGQKQEKKDNVTVRSDAGKIAIQRDKDKITIQGRNGKTKFEIATGGSLSVRMPSFLAAYPGAKIVSSMHGTGEDDRGGGIVFTTTDAPADVIAFYKKAASAAGMQETMNAQTGGTQILVASAKSGGDGFHVSATSADSGTQVSLFWSQAD